MDATADDKKLYTLRDLDGKLLAKGSYLFCCNRARRAGLDDEGFRIDSYWTIEEPDEGETDEFIRPSVTLEKNGASFDVVFVSSILVSMGIIMVVKWLKGW